MIIEESRFILRDGRECLFRSPLYEDAKANLDYLIAIGKETEFVLRYPEEVTMTEEQEWAFLSSVNNSPYQAMACAIVDGRLAGNCFFAGRSLIKTKHRCSVAIGLYKAYWGLGIGTLMMAELDNIAQRMGCTRMELEYVEGNERAAHLYKKCGYTVYGERPRAILLKSGEYRSEILMVKEI